MKLIVDISEVLHMFTEQLITFAEKISANRILFLIFIGILEFPTIREL